MLDHPLDLDALAASVAALVGARSGVDEGVDRLVAAALIVRRPDTEPEAR